MNERPAGAGRKWAVPPRISFGRLIDDFFVLASGQFLSKVFGFLAFAMLARRLTVEDYGAVETAVGMAAIGVIALEMGTGAVGVRRIAQSKANAPETLGAVMTGRMALAILVAPTLALIYIILSKSDAPPLLFWLYAASLFAVPFNHNWFFQSQEKMGVAGFGLTLKMATFFVMLLALAPHRNGVVFVAVAELAAAAAMVAWFAIFARRRIRPSRPKYKLDAGVKLLRESAQLGVSSFVNALTQYLPVLVVAAAANDSETAKFGASQRLIISLMTFSYVYYFNLYPLMARKFVDDHKGLESVTSASARVTAWVGVAAAGLLWAGAPLVMRIAYGENFREAGAEFGLLAWSGALILVSGNARWLLVAAHRQSSLLAAQIVSAVLTIGLGLLLAGPFGGDGAAIACLVGAAGLWASAHWLTRGLPVRARLADSAPAAIAALFMLTIATAFDLDLMFRIALVVGVVIAAACLDRKLAPSFKSLGAAKSA